MVKKNNSNALHTVSIASKCIQTKDWNSDKELLTSYKQVHCSPKSAILISMIWKINDPLFGS